MIPGVHREIGFPRRVHGRWSVRACGCVYFVFLFRQEIEQEALHGLCGNETWLATNGVPLVRAFIQVLV